MRMARKIEFEAMPLKKLELEKQRMFKKVLMEEEPKKYRNLLYELLGVIEWKKRFDFGMA
ncbi:hypothetical protein J7L85_01335 [candidate division WOR-3 bacterium]|nr:hypothetical protein [candidate division WOR-3 bacterium]